MYILNPYLKKIFNKFGFNISRIDNRNELELTQLVNSFKHNDIGLVLDVGANKGQFALNLRRAGYVGLIISFEPLPKEHKILELLSKQDNEWIIFKRCALGEKKEESYNINYSMNSVSSSILPILKEHTDSSLESIYIDKIQIEIEKLDDHMKYIESFNKNIFLKIDTQGYEMNVLKGSEKIMNNIKGIQCEFSLSNLYEGQADWKKLYKYIEDFGFNIWSVSEGFNDKKNGKTHQIDVTFYK